MRNKHLLFGLILLLLCLLIACTNLGIPQAIDPNWAKAQATTNANLLTTEANYHSVQGTASSATRFSELAFAQATSTQEARKTIDSLQLALTVDSATVQARETADMTTAKAVETKDAQERESIAQTSTASALATTDAFRATEQAYSLARQETEARKNQATSIAFLILMVGASIIFIILLAWFGWKATPMLINRLGIFRYGQHQNPLLLSVKNGSTVITDPLRMLQASLTISEQAEAIMKELTPNQVQALLASGQLYHLIEQVRNAPGHAPQLPHEIIRREKQNGQTITTTHKYSPKGSTTKQSAQSQPVESIKQLPMQVLIPEQVSWQTLQSHTGNGLIIGMGEQQVIAIDPSKTPHILLSGTSGSGKTRRSLRPLVAQALTQGMVVPLLNESGADFSPFYDHPNAILVRGGVGDYIYYLQSILAEMNRREEVLRQARVSEWQRLPPNFVVEGPSILVVIDEILSLTTMMTPQLQKDFWGLLTAYASRARKLSMGSIGALTDPTYRVLGAGLNWREQCTARISYRVAKATVSRAVLDEGGAEHLKEGQFLATLGAPNLVAGVAANPSDQELGFFMRDYPLVIKSVPSAIRQPETTSPQLHQPVATGSTNTTYVQPQPDQQPQLVETRTVPFDRTREPTEAEKEHIRSLFESGMSKNAICKEVYGYKDGRTYQWITEAVGGGTN